MNSFSKSKIDKSLLDSLQNLREALTDDSEALHALEVIEMKLSSGSNGSKGTNTGKSFERGQGPFILPNDMEKGPLFFALFSDGACRGNPGPGAWGALGQDSEGCLLFEASGVEFQTTSGNP